MCPAVVDPFRGPYYRTAAVFHQALCLLTLGKIYTFIVKTVLKVTVGFGDEDKKRE